MELHEIVHKLKNNTRLSNTEEIKYSYVLPTLQYLGYDIFDTAEVKPVNGIWDKNYMSYIISLRAKNVFSIVVVNDIEDVDFDRIKQYWALNDGSIMTLVTDGNIYDMYVKTFAAELKPTRRIKLTTANAEAIELFNQYSKESVLSGKGLGQLKEHMAKEYVSLISSWAKGEREVPKFLTRFIIQMAGLYDNDVTHKELREMFNKTLGEVSKTVNIKTPVVLDTPKTSDKNSNINAFNSGVKEDTDIVKKTAEVVARANTAAESVETGKRKRATGGGRVPSLETWYGIATYQTEFAKRVHKEKFGGKTTGTRDSYEENNTNVVVNKSEAVRVDTPVKKDVEIKKPNKFVKKEEETVEQVLARAASRRGLDEDTVVDEGKLKSVGEVPAISTVPSINNQEYKRIMMRKEVNHNRVIANADMYNNGKCILMCGAKIVKEVNRDDKDAVALRNKYKESILGDTLLTDIEFQGLRDATAFVCGFYDYKYADWRDEKGKEVEVDEIGGIE